MGQHKSFLILPGGRIKPNRNRRGGILAEKGRGENLDPIALRRKAERGPRLAISHTPPGILGFDVPFTPQPLAAASYNGNGHIVLRFTNGHKVRVTLKHELATAI